MKHIKAVTMVVMRDGGAASLALARAWADDVAAGRVPDPHAWLVPGAASAVDVSSTAVRREGPAAALARGWLHAEVAELVGTSAPTAADTGCPIKPF
jgi:hypothetical protein